MRTFPQELREIADFLRDLNNIDGHAMAFDVRRAAQMIEDQEKAAVPERTPA